MSQGAQWQIECGPHHATIAQRGGAIRSYRVGGAPVIADVADDEVPTAFHGAVLAPWPNRITGGRWSWRGARHQLAVSEPRTDSALHGLLSWMPWRLVEAGSDRVRLAATVLPQPGYPFEIEVSVNWSVSLDGLCCELGAENLGQQDAPFGVATHPYFVLDGSPVDELTLSVPATHWLRTDPQLHPVELVLARGGDLDFTEGHPLRGRSLDTAFTGLIGLGGLDALDGVDSAGTGSTVRLGDGRRELEIWADPSFGWWQVYTSDYFAADSPHYRSAVAIEAMTCGPDAFNSGRDLIVLPPSGRWSGRWTVRSHELA